MRKILVVAVVLPFLSAASAVTARDVQGYWMTDDGMMLVEIAPCTKGHETLCGFIRALPGAAKDVELRQYANALCGLPMLSNLSRDEHKNRWDGGQIFDPESERFYDAYIKIKKNTLAVRAYISAEAFGETMFWTPSTASNVGCASIKEQAHE